jgi:hypothetical protein
MRQDYVIDIDDAKIQKVGRVKDNPYPEQSRSFFSSDVVASEKNSPDKFGSHLILGQILERN